ncbi:MAG: methyltransferase domain-containing protein [Chloroflexi bacterium]|nr:methyltransferase domain-containing protein [Chloroflexota bacterium]
MASEAIVAAQDRRGPDDPAGIHRLHVGCGPHNLMPDWWNVDIRQFHGVDQVVDVTLPWPWHGLDFVYGEHFLEHLPLDGAISFLGQASSALRPGGRIRLSTPGLEWVWRTHFDPVAAPDRVRAMTYQANRAFYGWGHQFLYSRPMIEHVLRAAGFEVLTFHAFGESDEPALRGLERHAGYQVVDGWPNVWIVQATATSAASTGSLMAEAEHELERHRRSAH